MGERLFKPTQVSNSPKYIELFYPDKVIKICNNNIKHDTDNGTDDSTAYESYIIKMLMIYLGLILQPY